MPRRYQDFYDAHALGYFNQRHSEQKWFNSLIEEPAIRDVLNSINCRGNALDVGCGTGIYTNLLAQYGFTVVGIDLSENLLEFARSKYQADGIDFIHSDISNFTTSTKFDLSLASFIPGYFSDLDLLFSRLSLLVRPGGTQIITMLHPIRTSSNFRRDGVYISKNYLKNKTYFSDIVYGAPNLELYHHSFGEVLNAVSSNGFIIDRCIEPILEESPNGSKFYRTNPSILVLVLQRN